LAERYEPGVNRVLSQDEKKKGLSTFLYNNQ
jgi:hypothetical protein